MAKLPASFTLVILSEKCQSLVWFGVWSRGAWELEEQDFFQTRWDFTPLRGPVGAVSTCTRGAQSIRRKGWDHLVRCAFQKFLERL